MNSSVSAPAGHQRLQHFLDLLVVLLVLIGIYLMPVQLRYPILFKRIGYIGYINFPACLAVLLSLFRLRKWHAAEWICFGLWLLMLIPMIYSNREVQQQRAITALCQNLLPLFLLLFRMEPESRGKTIRVALVFFDVFVLLFLGLSVIEKLTDHAVLTAIRDWLGAHHYKTSAIDKYLTDNLRFSSVWAHPLTHAFLFNAFFVVNVIYLRENGRKCPVILFFALTLVGLLMTAAKTGILIFVPLTVVLCWKQKKWFLLAIPFAALLYFAGAFDNLLERFVYVDLTSGRLDDLKAYFSSGIYPLQFFSGYGTNAVLTSSHPLHAIDNAFEPPLMMFAFDYGILPALILIGSVYAYATWRFLREKKWLPWICYSLLFAEINTYNAYAARHQDVCFTMTFLTLLLLSMTTGKQTSACPRS